MGDWWSRWSFVRLKLDRRMPERFQLPPDDISLRIRALGGGTYLVRPRSTDAQMVIYDYVHAMNAMPPEIAEGRVETVVEIGCNAGAGLLDYAIHHPEAQVLGVEADPGNAARLAQMSPGSVAAAAWSTRRYGPRGRSW